MKNVLCHCVRKWRVWANPVTYSSTCRWVSSSGWFVLSTGRCWPLPTTVGPSLQGSGEQWKPYRWPTTEGYYWPEEIKERWCGYLWKCNYRGANAKPGWNPGWHPDEVFTQTADQTLAQNSDDPVIRRQDIESLVQEIVTYVETVNNTLGSGQQGSLSPPIEWPNVTTTTTTGVPPSVTTTTTTTTTVVPPQDRIALNPPVLIQRFGA